MAINESSRRWPVNVIYWFPPFFFFVPSSINWLSCLPPADLSITWISLGEHWFTCSFTQHIAIHYKCLSNFLVHFKLLSSTFVLHADIYLILLLFLNKKREKMVKRNLLWWSPPLPYIHPWFMTLDADAPSLLCLPSPLPPPPSTRSSCLLLLVLQIKHQLHSRRSLTLLFLLANKFLEFHSYVHTDFSFFLLHTRIFFTLSFGWKEREKF